jgi:serralysin
LTIIRRTLSGEIAMKFQLGRSSLGSSPRPAEIDAYGGDSVFTVADGAAVSRTVLSMRDQALADDPAKPAFDLDPRFDSPHRPSDWESGTVSGANGAGRTELIDQTYNATLNRYEFTGNQQIDAVLIGSRWTPTNLTFSFPTSGAFYADQGYAAGTEPDGLVPFNAQQQDALRYAFAQISAYTNVTFTEVTESETVHANFRFAQTSYGEVPSAYANFPSSSAQAGDSWFGMTNQPFYDTPAPGNWGQATIMHELGHALGLKHGHQDYTTFDLAEDGYLDHPSGTEPRYGTKALPSNIDGQDWSLMTYRSDPGNTATFEGEGFNQPQTYMQSDIAALQHLYGADFTTQGGDTVYTWNPETGQQSINGVGQYMPTSNKISMTLWDGNGTDTYDLSNYTSNLSLDLRPGEFSTFSQEQLVNHRAYSGGTAIAVGSVANALLYQGDVRSLIENAKGGTGADKIIGNQTFNVLTGNAGVDTLIGDAGADQLYGGNDADYLYGDLVDGMPSGVGFGPGSFNKPVGLGNVSMATAADVGNLFSLASDPFIIDSTSAPHVSITGAGDGNKDYYKLTVVAGSTITLDIDATTGGLDSFIRLLAADGSVLAVSDDSASSSGGGGSTSGLDSFLSFTVTASGTYYAEVGQYLAAGVNAPITLGKGYTLQISAAGVPQIGSGSGNDILDGGAGADTMRGNAGSDIYLVDSALDIVIEQANEGIDRINSAASYILSANVEDLLLTGTAAVNGYGNNLANKLTGNSGNNVLDGAAGNDTMAGVGGNDTYFVDSSSDVVTELAGSGSDRVNASVSYLLGANVEELVLTGTSEIFGTGNDLANRLYGNSGANVLNGGSGADIMNGGSGNDTYVVDNIGDVVTEASGGGTDKVNASVSYTLAPQVETLVLTGAAAINGSGNGIANQITGNSAANVLNGGGGNDTMTGGSGDDTYVVSDAGDLVVESAGGGIDMAQSAITYALTAEVEKLMLTGTASINGTGNGLANAISGNSAANILNGNNGSDTLGAGGGDDTLNGGDAVDYLVGGAGADLMTGGIGADRFIYTALSESAFGARDRITDLLTAQGDKIDLSAIDTRPAAGDQGFSFIGTGAFTGAGAQVQVLYGTGFSTVLIDLDGNMAAEFAIRVDGIDAAHPLTAANFVL